MKKNKLLIALIAILLPFGASAQLFQKYYRWANVMNIDHGPFNECLTRISGTGVVTHYACGGATDAANGQDVATLVETSNIGNPNWIHMYQSPVTNTTDFTAVSMADATGSAVFGLLCNYTNGAGVQSVILVQTNYAGAYLGNVDLGPGIGTSIAYDVNTNCFAVLGMVGAGTGAGQNFEITQVNAATLAVNWDRQYDGCSGTDSPGSIMVDVNDYVAIGTSLNANVRQMMIVKTNNAAVPVWAYTQVFGSPVLDELPSDICVYTDAAGAKQYGISGYANPAAPFLFCATVNPAGPAAGMFMRELTGITGLSANALGFSIAYSPAGPGLIVTGRQNDVNQNAIVMFFQNNAALTTIATSVSLYDNPALAGNEELRDVTHFNVAAFDMLYCGLQQRTVAWGTSPAGQNYSWLMTTDSRGTGTCPLQPTFTTVTPAMTVVSCTAPTPSVHAVSITLKDFNSDYQLLDNCVTPSRLANPASASVAYRVFPNPANAALTVAAASTATDLVEFELFDMTGRSVMKETIAGGTYETNFDVNSIANGLYVYHLTVNGAMVLTNKIVIAH